MTAVVDPDLKNVALRFQRAEETDAAVYMFMAGREKNKTNNAVLVRIANEEREHAKIWKRYSGRDVGPSRVKTLWYSFLSILMGYTFVLKLMEMGEDGTAAAYAKLIGKVPELKRIMQQEQAHERELMDMLDEERLHYVGAMVLGLNDALVELTGTIAGLTFALANTRLVALAGIITGVSATLSMAASNYLAERANDNPKAFKSCLYTGIAYLATVVLLVLPYLLFPEHMYFAALGTMLLMVVLIIFFFNYYISVAKSQPFLKRFGEMAAISLGVAVISFAIGLAVKYFLGIEI